MTERYLSVCAATLIAWACWLVGTTVVVLSCAGVLDHPYASLGGIVTMFGCMTMLRCWVQRAARSSANAFTLGRDSVHLVQ